MDDLQAIPAQDLQAVEIVDDDGSIYLLRLDDQGECVADTWHETVEEAKAQASFEFGIEDGDWIDVALRH